LLDCASVLTSDATPSVRLAPPFRPPREGEPDAALHLVGRDGESLGTVELGRPDWPVGSVIHRGNKPNLRVVRVAVSDDSEDVDDVLVVEEVLE
jgi:hypothetical protein